MFLRIFASVQNIKMLFFFTLSLCNDPNDLVLYSQCVYFGFGYKVGDIVKCVALRCSLAMMTYTTTIRYNRFIYVRHHIQIRHLFPHTKNIFNFSTRRFAAPRRRVVKLFRQILYNAFSIYTHMAASAALRCLRYAHAVGAFRLCNNIYTKEMFYIYRKKYIFALLCFYNKCGDVRRSHT